MAYNDKNRLRRIKRIQEVTQQHYEPDISSYKGIWRKYIYPEYFISYDTYLEYINTPIKKEDLC